MSHVYAAERRGVRPLAPATQAKVDAILKIAARREGLRRVQDAAARIQAELEHRLEQARRSGGADEGHLLREVRSLRVELDAMEI